MWLPQLGTVGQAGFPGRGNMALGCQGTWGKQGCASSHGPLGSLCRGLNKQAVGQDVALCLAHPSRVLVPRWCCLKPGDLCDTLGGGRSWHPPTQLCRVQWGAESYPISFWVLGNPGSQELACTAFTPLCWEQAGHCQAVQRGCHRPGPKVLSLVTAPGKLEHLRRGAGHWASAMVVLWLCRGISLCAGSGGTLQPTVAFHPQGEGSTVFTFPCDSSCHILHPQLA